MLQYSVNVLSQSFNVNILIAQCSQCPACSTLNEALVDDTKKKLQTAILEAKRSACIKQEHFKAAWPIYEYFWLSVNTFFLSSFQSQKCDVCNWLQVKFLKFELLLNQMLIPFYLHRSHMFYCWLKFRLVLKAGTQRLGLYAESVVSIFSLVLLDEMTA